LPLTACAPIPVQSSSIVLFSAFNIDMFRELVELNSMSPQLQLSPKMPVFSPFF
jgi:hypothetical protein